MTITTILPPEPEQPKPTREQILALGLEPVQAYCVPEKRKRTLAAVRKDAQRERDSQAGLERLDLTSTRTAAPLLRLLARASVTGMLSPTLQSLIIKRLDDLEDVTGHIDDSQAPGVERWVGEMRSPPNNPPPQSQTPGSRPSKEYKVGRYVLQLTGWRRGLFELAYMLATFKLSDLIPRGK
jgi:hypothetical protein